MQATFLIETVEQAKQLLKPQRLEILKQLDEPNTCPQLAERFGQTPQQIYYHIKALEKAGLVEKTGERRVRGINEGFYQAKARSYWLAPTLVKGLGSKKQAQDQVSLRFLLNLAEEMFEDIGRLGHRSSVGQDVPSMGLSAHVHLPDGSRRAEFLHEVSAIFQHLATKYGLPTENADEAASEAANEAAFRLVLACYPDPINTDISNE